MILKQYYLGCLAHASYLIADEQAGVAAVVDPQRDIDQYLADAKAHGVAIRHVFLTHFHADFLAGHIELRDRTGATIHLGARAKAEFPFRAMKDGDTLALGAVTLEILETPGHTPEGISIVVHDGPLTAPPHAVLTGDTLFIGDVGRPDLMASIGITAQELGGQLYDSLHDKLLKLPDETLLYPAHGAGSMCGKNLSSATVCTIGRQRQNNYALQPMSRAQFIELVSADQPKAPGYFLYDAMKNREERAPLDAVLANTLKPVPLAELLRRMNAGEVKVIDVREPADFDRSHLAGTWNIGLSGQFATWAGTLLKADDEILIIADPGREAEAATRLGRIGFDRLAGYLDGGPRALDQRRELLRSTERVESTDLARRLAGDAPPLLLDVRNEGEVAQARVEGSVHIPLRDLPQRIGELPRDRAIVVMCRSGYRSAIGASILDQAGHHVADQIGGIQAWQKCDLPVCTAAPASA